MRAVVISGGRSSVRQKAELTFKYNIQEGRHGWLRLTPAYSVQLVRKILMERPTHKKVIDPFSGTSTTPLCAAELGITGVGADINPFLVWLGKTKTSEYSENTIATTKSEAEKIVNEIGRDIYSRAKAPPIRNITRWWDAPQLDFLCSLKGAIDQRSSIFQSYDLLLVSFCRTLIKISNAAFNHQSMSFKSSKIIEEEQLSLLPDEKVSYGDLFLKNVEFVTRSTEHPLQGASHILQDDARNLTNIRNEYENEFDLLVTSPPYPNRMSYIRELRPYMYWLGYLSESYQAGNLDWEAIGGTWGIATSRLSKWMPSHNAYTPDYLDAVIKAIKNSHETNGHLMAQYIHKYFEDIWFHILSVRNVVKKGGHVHYIVGNSIFYGHLVPVDRIYADMLSQAGFTQVQMEIVRKRNSKKELFEYIVSAVR